MNSPISPPPQRTGVATTLTRIEVRRSYECLLSVRLSAEIDMNLRSKIRALLGREGFDWVGTTLYSGAVTDDQIERICDLIIDAVNTDPSPAYLTNLRVWVFGHSEFEVPDEILDGFLELKRSRPH